MKANTDYKNTPMRALEDHRRCARAGCELRAIDGSEYCAIHHQEKRELPRGLYSIDKIRVLKNLSTMRQHPDSKNLEVELALMRTLLERVLQRCTDDNDLLRNSGQIMQLIDRIATLLKNNVNISQITKELLSIDEVVMIAQEIVNIVSEYLDVDTLTVVSERIEGVLSATK